jgi:hypothetical protein
MHVLQNKEIVHQVGNKNKFRNAFIIIFMILSLSLSLLPTSHCIPFFVCAHSYTFRIRKWFFRVVNSLSLYIVRRCSVLTCFANVSHWRWRDHGPGCFQLLWDDWKTHRFVAVNWVVPVPVAARSKHRSAAAGLLGMWVRIPSKVWMSVCCECCVLSGRGLCDELITRPEESYPLWCVVVCDLETSRMRRPWPTGGCCAKNKQTNWIKYCSLVLI